MTYLVHSFVILRKFYPSSPLHLKKLAINQARKEVTIDEDDEMEDEDGIHVATDNAWSHPKNAKHSHSEIMAKTKKNKNKIIASNTSSKGEGYEGTAAGQEKVNTMANMRELLELNFKILTMSKDGDSAGQALLDALNEEFKTKIKKGLDLNHYLKAFTKHLAIDTPFGKNLFDIIKKENPEYGQHFYFRNMQSKMLFD